MTEGHARKLVGSARSTNRYRARKAGVSRRLTQPASGLKLVGNASGLRIFSRLVSAR
jgi:hypothetical protein